MPCEAAPLRTESGETDRDEMEPAADALLAMTSSAAAAVTARTRRRRMVPPWRARSPDVGRLDAQGARAGRSGQWHFGRTTRSRRGGKALRGRARRRRPGLRRASVELSRARVSGRSRAAGPAGRPRRRVVRVGGPRRQQEQDPGIGCGAQRVALAGRERDERGRHGLDRLAAGDDRHRSRTRPGSSRARAPSARRARRRDAGRSRRRGTPASRTAHAARAARRHRSKGGASARCRNRRRRAPDMSGLELRSAASGAIAGTSMSLLRLLDRAILRLPASAARRRRDGS